MMFILISFLVYQQLYNGHMHQKVCTIEVA
jgi:hypothetical protein